MHVPYSEKTMQSDEARYPAPSGRFFLLLVAAGGVVGLALLMLEAPFWLFYAAPVLMMPFVVWGLRSLDGAAAPEETPPNRVVLVIAGIYGWVVLRWFDLFTELRLRLRLRRDPFLESELEQARARVRMAKEGKALEVAVVPVKEKWFVSTGEKLWAPQQGTFETQQQAVKAAFKYLMAHGGGELVTMDWRGEVDSRVTFPSPSQSTRSTGVRRFAVTQEILLKMNTQEAITIRESDFLHLIRVARELESGSSSWVSAGWALCGVTVSLAGIALTISEQWMLAGGFAVFCGLAAAGCFIAHRHVNQRHRHAAEALAAEMEEAGSADWIEIVPLQPKD